ILSTFIDLINIAVDRQFTNTGLLINFPILNYCKVGTWFCTNSGLFLYHKNLEWIVSSSFFDGK
ncbi:hypothetical protein CHH69_17225, partial [Terribacillus saccharophilus]